MIRLLLIISMVLPIEIVAQNVQHCGQLEAMRRFKQKHPDYEQKVNQAKQKFIPLHTNNGKKIIPVVFHIMHTYGVENISDAQVQSAIDILNQDFSLTNADTSEIVPAFKNIKGNANIEFRLARKDPNGNCTNGIDRIYSTTTNTGGDEVKEGTQWDPTRYYNIWVVKRITFGAAGYAYYPTTADFWPEIDGVVMLHNYTGSIGTSSYYTGRVISHETGHWLELQHVWGDTNEPEVACGDDEVFDTPVTRGWTSCNIDGSICTPGVIESVQNYMEYSYCGRMFTQGQVDRMLGILNSNIAQRNNLWSPDNLIFTGTDDATYAANPTCKPIADFKSNVKLVCPGVPVAFTDLSYNGQPTQWRWEFEGATPSTSTLENPTIVYNRGGVYKVKLVVQNTAGADSVERLGYISVLHDSIIYQNYFREDFENYSPSTSLFTIDNDAEYSWQLYSDDPANFSLVLENSLYQIPVKTFFITPPIDLTTIPSPILSFRIAFAQFYSSNTNNLKVFANANCSNNWIMRYNKSGDALQTNTNFSSNSFYPTSPNDWRYENVIINNVANSSRVRFKFEYTNESGNNIFIDDINVYSLITGNAKALDNFLQITIYPNPSQQNQNLVIKGLQHGKTTITLSDIAGKVIYKKVVQLNTDKTELYLNDLEKISSGIYLLHIQSGNQNYTQKWMVE